MQAQLFGRLALSATHGLSLIELLVSLAIAATVTAYAVPGLQVVVANNQQTGVINRFVASVLLARSIAITQHTEAIICPSLDGETCHNENDWSQGWIVIQIATVVGDTINDTGSVIRVEQEIADVSLKVNRTLFRFRPRGRRATNGTAIMCQPRATRPKAVIVSYSGRPRTSGVLANGDDITCDPSLG